MSRPTKIALGILALTAAAIVAGLYARSLFVNTPQVDERMQVAIAAVQVLSTYEMTARTTTALSDRIIEVAGLYRLDFARNRFASYATTTLIIPSEPKATRSHEFSLQNIAIADDVYVKIETESPFLKQTIPHSAQWRHFNKAAIPPQFEDIAVAGPVLDNLALLKENGRYISLVAGPLEVQNGEDSYYLYRFELSADHGSVGGGTLRSLLNRIGTGGTVDIWLDETPSIRVIVARGDNYVSTTTVLGINTPLEIRPPVQ